MPQLSQIGEIYASQLFWLAIVFALIYFGIGKAMVPRIERTIDDRAARITGDLAAAEHARRVAHNTDEAYHAGLDSARSQAMKTIADAHGKATASIEAKTKESDAVLASRTDAAMARIGETRRAALTEIEVGTVDAVEAIVAKLSGVSIDRAAAEQQVKAELAHG